MLDNQDNTFIHRQYCDGYFTNIFNSCLETKLLSLAAKGLLCYILSRPKNWRINLKQLADVLQTPGKRGSGIESIKSCMTELKKAEYVLYSKIRNSRGHWEHHYHVYPLPLTLFQKMFPEVVKPALDEPALVKPPINTIKERKQEKKKQPVIVCAPVAPEKKIVSDKEKVVAQEEAFSDHAKIAKQGFGKTHEICKNDILTYAVQKRKVWSPEDIDKAWSILIAYTEPIRDVYSFLEGTISNNKKLQGLKSFDEKIENTYGKKSKGSRSSQNKNTNETHKIGENSTHTANKEEIERLRNQEIERLKKVFAQQEEEERAKKIPKKIPEFKPTEAQRKEILRICKKEYENLTAQQRERMRQYFEGN